ncbi:MAG: hypothetical protein KC777_24445, partial [Cyanobacteria bacterium HKST-UBA02]|nr:hypothetical protein [Cyanobacteria bacterium HKST-UBA02]
MRSSTSPSSSSASNWQADRLNRGAATMTGGGSVHHRNLSPQEIDMIKMTRHYVLAGRQTPAREVRLDSMQALAELASFYLVPQAMQIASDERKIELWR